MRAHSVIVATAMAALAAAAAAGTGASNESFRLAFSKAGNIEIFIDHAQGSEWCAPALKLRAVHGGEPNQQALAALLPKLGALLDRQCPQASQIDWTSTTADGRTVARGTSTKTDRWAMRTTPSAVAAAPAAAPPAAVRVAPVPPPADDAAREPAPPTAVAAAPSVSVFAPAPAAAAEPVQPAPAEPTQSAAAEPAQSASAEPAQSAATPPTTAIGDFEVNGWKPLDAAKAREQADFLKEFKDQNGCRILTTIDRTDLASLTLQSEELQCGADGYASGRGRLILDRSDGVRVGRTGMMWFVEGVPLRNEMGPARLAGADASRTLWFFLGSDSASKSHFLLRAQPASQSGIGIWVPAAQIDAITGDEAQFRQAAPIQAAVDAALAAFDRNGMPDARWVKLVFANDFSKVVDPARSADHLVYEIQPARQRSRRGSDPSRGSWQVNLQQATNHLFQRDARLAQQKAMEEQRAAQRRLVEEQRAAQRLRVEAMQRANVERRKLQTYRSFVDAADDPKRLLSSVESDLDYTPGSGGSYARVLAGEERRIRRIVHVSGRDGNDATVDFPYEMRLVDQREVKAGWYLVQGIVALDGKRLDGDGLPLTLVTLAGEPARACRKDGCVDLLDPLALTRLKLGEPDWTPEAATALIEGAGLP